ncbi:MAG: hypothetical protein WC881_10435 [Elusimicrobiota bacterium]|jgi:hypothetical protein
MIRILATGLCLGLAISADCAALRPGRVGLPSQRGLGLAAPAVTASPRLDIAPILAPAPGLTPLPASGQPVVLEATAAEARQPQRAWDALQAVSLKAQSAGECAAAETAAGRLSAVMDGAGRPAAETAGDAEPVSLGQLHALKAADVPVNIRWQDRDSGQLRNEICRISGVSNVQDVSQGRWRSWDVVYVDVAPFRIYVEDLRSVSPAGISTREYFARVQPQAQDPLEMQLARTGLSPVQIEAIRTRSRGVLTAPEFLRSAPAGGLSLGVTDNLDQYAAMVRTAGLVHWKIMYRKLMGDIRNPRPAQFMERLLALGRPVYVFLPPGQVTEEDYPNTYAELAWLLEHPERMRNVQFVSGAYGLFSREDEARWFRLRGAGLRRQMLGDLFQRIRSGER